MEAAKRFTISSVNRARLDNQLRTGLTSDMTVTDVARGETMPFGRHSLIFEEPIPPWSRELLTRISTLGELEEGWDSYGARPVDPLCAVTTVKFVLGFLDGNSPEPAIVPTNRGGIQLEWCCAEADLEIEIESPVRFQVFFEDKRTGEEREFTLSDNLTPLKPLLKRLAEAE